MNMQKQFIQLQLALFFKNTFEGVIEKASLALKAKFGADMGTQIINVPPIAPVEIPRLILTSDQVNINLAKNRIDFFTKKKSFASDNIANIFYVLGELGVEVGRIGLVLTFFKESDLVDLKSLLNGNAINLSNTAEITIRLNEKTTIQGINYNNSQMYVSASAKDAAGETKNGVVITRDINSRAEDSNTFSSEALGAFLNEALPLGENTLI